MTAVRTSDDLRARSVKPRPSTALWIGILALAFLPILIRFGAEQWTRSQYQFFPLVIVAAIYLAWQRLRDLASENVSPGSPLITTALLLLSVVMLAAANAALVGRLAAGSAIIAIIAVFWHAGGLTFVRAAMPSCVLLGLVTGLPAGLDVLILQRLRELAVWLSSHVLAWSDIPHLTSGTVIEIQGSRLLVAEACSGINSMMAVFSFTLVLGFLRHRSGLHTSLLLAASVPIVIWANMIRIAGGVWLHVTRNVDVLSGDTHDWASLILFSVSMVIVMSTDIAIARVAYAIRHRRRRLKRADRDPVAPAAGPVIAVLARARLSAGPGLWAVSLLALIAGSYGVAMGSLHGGVVNWVKGSVVSNLPESVALTLPQEIAGWKRSAEAEKDVVQAELVGKKSQAWVLERGDIRAVVAIDFPFEGFHDLSVCYVNAGWLVDSVESSANQEGVYVSAKLSRLNEHGYFWYSLLDEQGTWVKPRPRETLARLAARVRDTNPNECAYQIQVWVQSYDQLSQDQQAALARLFLAARNELAAQVMQQIGGAR